MSTDSRRRLGAITALVLGLFVGLTLLPLPITGPVGRTIGHGLWQILGAGALGIPLLGIGLAMAGFDRLGKLDMKRSAILITGLSVLFPYLIGVLTGVSRIDLDPDIGQRGFAASVVGTLPGFFADIISGKVGQAGRGAGRVSRALRADSGHVRLASLAAPARKAGGGQDGNAAGQPARRTSRNGSDVLRSLKRPAETHHNPPGRHGAAEGKGESAEEAGTGFDLPDG